MIEETFSSVFAVFDYLKTKGWGGFYHTNPCFEVMQLAENQLVACPMPMNPLYRGQSAIYTPCKQGAAPLCTLVVRHRKIGPSKQAKPFFWEKCHNAVYASEITPEFSA